MDDTGILIAAGLVAVLACVLIAWDVERGHRRRLERELESLRRLPTKVRYTFKPGEPK